MKPETLSSFWRWSLSFFAIFVSVSIVAIFSSPTISKSGIFFKGNISKVSISTGVDLLKHKSQGLLDSAQYGQIQKQSGVSAVLWRGRRGLEETEKDEDEMTPIQRHEHRLHSATSPSSSSSSWPPGDGAAPPPPAPLVEVHPRMWAEARRSVGRRSGRTLWTLTLLADTGKGADSNILTTYEFNLTFHATALQLLEVRGDEKWNPPAVNQRVRGAVKLVGLGVRQGVPQEECRGERLHIAAIIFKELGEKHNANPHSLFLSAEGGMLNIGSAYMVPSGTRLAIHNIPSKIQGSRKRPSGLEQQQKQPSSVGPQSLPPVMIQRKKMVPASLARKKDSVKTALPRRPSRALGELLRPPSLLYSSNTTNTTTLFSSSSSSSLSSLSPTLLAGGGPRRSASLSEARAELAACTAGDFVLFAGGVGPWGEMSSRVDMHSPREDKWRVGALSQARKGMAAVGTNGGRAVFAGGEEAGGRPSQVVDVYHSHTDHWTAHHLSQGRTGVAVAAFNDVVLIAGGLSNLHPEEREWWGGVDMLNTSSGEWLSNQDHQDHHQQQQQQQGTGQLSVARAHLAAVTLGPLVLFAGGSGGGEFHAVVDIYNSRESTWTVEALSQARSHLVAATTGNLALFGGGRGWVKGGGEGMHWDESDVVDVLELDPVTLQTNWRILQLSQPRSKLAGFGIGGNVAVFAGGTMRRPPSQIYHNPSCIFNCAPREADLHGYPHQQHMSHLITRPTPDRPKPTKFSDTPVGVRSYTMDVVISGCSQLIVAQLSRSRSSLAGSGLINPFDPTGNSVFAIVGGGEIRTRWNSPLSAGGLDFITSKIDLFLIETTKCQVIDLNSGMIFM